MGDEHKFLLLLTTHRTGWSLESVDFHNHFVCRTVNNPVVQSNPKNDLTLEWLLKRVGNFDYVSFEENLEGRPGTLTYPHSNFPVPHLF